MAADPALLAMAAMHHAAGGSSSTSAGEVDKTADQMDMRAFASEMRDLVSTDSSQMAKIKAREESGGMSTPVAKSLLRGKSTRPKKTLESFILYKACTVLGESLAPHRIKGAQGVECAAYADENVEGSTHCLGARGCCKCAPSGLKEEQGLMCY